MNTSTSQKKAILSDPVSLFTQEFPNATKEQLTSLQQLKLQYVELKTKLTEIQAQGKKISRQIGDAKRNNQPTKKLVSDMQDRSRTINHLKTEINGISEKILLYFEHKNSEKKNEPTASKPLPPTREHSGVIADSEQFSILQLEDEYNSWNDYVDSNPAASLYHRAEWKYLIKKVFGHECYFYYASKNNQVVGVLPLVRLKSKLFGDFLVSMPYFNSGGAVANSLQMEQELMNAANSHAKKITASHVEYRDDISRKSLPSRTGKVNMILSLPETENKLWNSFPSKLRSQVMRARREKVNINAGGREFLADFYTVFTQKMRDLGTPVYGKDFFNEILQTFPESSTIISINLGGRPVAAAFLLGYKDTLEVPWASTIKEVNHLSINML